MSPLFGNQRWRQGRAVYRPPDEPIRTGDYDVVALPHDAFAKPFVLEHHYSGSYPAARWRFGLFRCGVLQGIAVFSHPCNDRVLTGVFPGRPTDSIELGRFVLLDEVPGNGETWFLAPRPAVDRGEVACVLHPGGAPAPQGPGRHRGDGGSLGSGRSGRIPFLYLSTG